MLFFLTDTTLTQKGELDTDFEKQTLHDKFHSKQVPTYKKREWRTGFYYSIIPANTQYMLHTFNKCNL